MSEDQSNNAGKKLCTGAQNQTSLVDEYAKRIRAAQRQTTGSILAECGHYASADNALDDDAKRKLIEELGIDRTGFVKRVQVGKHDRLNDPAIRASLPPHLTTLYDLSCLDDDKLTEAISANIVHPSMRRRDLTTWVKGRRGKDEGPTSVADKAPYAMIYLPTDISTDDARLFQDELRDLCNNCGVAIRFPECEAEDRETQRINLKIDAYLRREGRKKIREIKHRRTGEKPRGTAKKTSAQSAWPYTSEQIAINATADLHRVEAVFNLLDAHDEFQEMLRGAYRSVRARRR
jgi:hypothetical protein